MQQLIARSPQQSHEPVVVFANVFVSPGMALLVGENDAAVFFRDGWVAGVVGPGHHALDPNAMPVLWNFRDPSGQIMGSDPQTKDRSSCTFDQPKWQSFKPGSQWVGEVGVIGGILSCGSLKPR